MLSNSEKFIALSFWVWFELSMMRSRSLFMLLACRFFSSSSYLRSRTCGSYSISPLTRGVFFMVFALAANFSVEI